VLSRVHKGDKVIEKATGLDWVVVEEYEDGSVLCERDKGDRVIGCYFLPEMLLRYNPPIPFSRKRP